MYKQRNICPASYCKADDPVQILIDQSHAEKAGQPHLVGAIRCTHCGTVWRAEDDGSKKILGRFAGPILGKGWIPRT